MSLILRTEAGHHLGDPLALALCALVFGDGGGGGRNFAQILFDRV
jgi:hypothetical protein